MGNVYFSHQNPANPISFATADINRSIHQFWLQLIDNEEHDADSLITELMRLTGQSRTDVNHAINAIYAMNNLPELRQLQENHYCLTIHYLSRVMTAVAQADPGLWSELDRRITQRLTPRTANEMLIQAGDLAGLITKWIKELDPNFKVKDKRAGTEADYLVIEHKEGATYFRGKLGPEDGRHFHAALRKLREKKMSLIEALRVLLDLKTPVKIVQNMYTPLTGGLSWIPGVGYFKPDEGDRVDEVIDLDDYADKEEDSYTPSRKLRNYVVARDGHCRWPGCRVPAHYCQLDHVIPYGEGGPTVAWNLMCLCQHHHNMKTDERFHADINSLAEVTWIGPMNSPVVSGPIGPLAPDMPTGIWGQTLRSRMESRFATIRERATAED